jgi:hypothetical protein
VDVVFERTDTRHYAIEVRRRTAPVLRMNQAPGFDHWFPHDLQHLVVEEQLGLTNGIYGRLARGGTASSFTTASADVPRDKRAASRQRRKLKRRDLSLAADEANDFARSERATYLAYYDFLAHSPNHDLRTKANDMDPAAESFLARMEDEERSALVKAIPRIRQRAREVTDDPLRLLFSRVAAFADDAGEAAKSRESTAFDPTHPDGQCRVGLGVGGELHVDLD